MSSLQLWNMVMAADGGDAGAAAAVAWEIRTNRTNGNRGTRWFLTAGQYLSRVGLGFVQRPFKPDHEQGDRLLLFGIPSPSKITMTAL
jgi:hypothetical protein